MLIAFLIILGVWGLLTIWAELPGPANSAQYGNNTSLKKVLVVYDPDPIYNLDEQLCTVFAEALARHDVYVTVATVKAAEELNNDYNLYMFCANTYNWRPDWAISRYIKKHTRLQDKPVVALTLGSGSTKEAKTAFDKIIIKTGAKLSDSRTLWLLRPNDEARMKEPNVQVAKSMIAFWADELATTQFSASETPSVSQ